MMSAYQIPSATCLPEGQDAGACSSQTNTPGRQQGFVTVANWKAAASSAVQNLTTASGNNDSDPESGYAVLAAAAAISNPEATFTEGSSVFTGARSVQFWSNLRYQSLYLTKPNWAFGVWFPPVVTVTAGDTTARLTARTWARSCKVAASASAFGSWDDSGDTAATMHGGFLSHTFTGLTASTTYNYRVTCGSNRVIGTFSTTAAAGGATSVLVTLKPPAGRSIDNALIDYGSTSGLGQSTSASCALGCSISVPGSTGRALFYRITYRTAANATVVQGPIQSGVL
jgi:hypothetical protein